MTDPDDVEAISLDYALRDLVDAAAKLADPWMGYREFVILVLAALSTPANRDLPLRRILLAAARRVRWEILDGL